MFKAGDKIIFWNGRTVYELKTGQLTEKGYLQVIPVQEKMGLVVAVTVAGQGKYWSRIQDLNYLERIIYGIEDGIQE